MYRYLIAVILVTLTHFSYAADDDQVWFYQSFTTITNVITSDSNPYNGISTLCRVKEHKDLTDDSQPPYSDGDTALGHNIGNFAYPNKVNDGLWQCVYSSANEGDDNLYYLYVYVEEKCTEGLTYDRKKRACSGQVSTCVSGEISLLAGLSSPLIQTAPYQTYVLDKTPESICSLTPDQASACTFKKPSYSHSCYSDSPLSWNGDTLAGSFNGHCNYEFVNSGDSCTLSPGQSLSKASGGYLMAAASNGGEFTCPPGVTDPRCSQPDNGGDGGSDGGDTGGGSDGGSDGGTGGGGTGGDTGGGSDGGSDGGGSDGGTGGGDTGGSGSSASGTACNASLTCSGDAVQCAILAQQKKAACALTDLTKVDQSAIATMLSGDKFQLEEKTVTATSLFERARFLPATCPAPQTFALSNGVFSIPYDLLCGFAEKFSYLLVLLASFFAMLIVFKD